MPIRSLRPSDLEPLHALYLSLTALMPHHLPVSLTQFADELTTSRFQDDENWDSNAEQILVAEVAGEPVAFAHVSFLHTDACYSALKAGKGMLRFAFSAPEQADALRELLTIVVETARQRDCPELRAFAGYAPLFHNGGQSAVSNAWPWIGRALVQSGFRTLGSPVLAMYCNLDAEKRTRLPLPSDAELRYDWVTRVGARDDSEGGYHIFVGDDRAAESMWHFGEKYVVGAGKSHVQLFWLGVNSPYRGRGLGRILLRETLVRAQELGARNSDLHCNFDNFYAHALYRAEGYQPTDLLWAFHLARNP